MPLLFTGIQVRSRKKGTYSTEMHNKYVLVDDEAVMTGSMNWTAEVTLYYYQTLVLIVMFNPTNSSIL